MQVSLPLDPELSLLRNFMEIDKPLTKFQVRFLEISLSVARKCIADSALFQVVFTNEQLCAFRKDTVSDRDITFVSNKLADLFMAYFMAWPFCGEHLLKKKKTE